jgi:hypothetical protein
MRLNQRLWILKNGKILTVTIFSLCAVFLNKVVSAESLDDFRNVASLDGCASIPYNDERRGCTDVMVDVNEWCKTGRWNSKEVAGTKNYLNAVDNLEKKIKELESDKSILGSNLSSAYEADKPGIEKQILYTEKTIYDLSERQKEQKEYAAGAKRELELRLQAGEKCLALRTQVQKYFDTAISRAKGESDTEIKSIAEGLVAKWEKSTEEHQQIMRDVTTGVNNCKDRLAGKY